MRVRFWGTRGSLPAASDATVIRDKIKRALLRAEPTAANSPITRRSSALSIRSWNFPCAVVTAAILRAWK